MRYLIAIIFPPLAVLLSRKPFQAVLNFALWLIGFVLFPIGIFVILAAVVHAFMAVSSRLADKRNEAVIKAIKSSR